MQAQIRDSDRLIIQIGNGLGERNGCTTLTVPDAVYIAIREAMATPNGGVLLGTDLALTVLDPPPLPPPPPPINYGSDDNTRDQLPQAVTDLRAYLGVVSPTAAQSTAALKTLIRVVLFVLRRLVPQ